MSSFAIYALAITVIAASLSSPAAMSGNPSQSSPYSGTPQASSKSIKGTASWDQKVVRDFFKAVMNIDIPDVPTAIPNPEMLDKVNPEFATRVKVLMAVYQASRPIFKVGIAPGDGGLRTADQQLNIFKKGRHDPAGPNGHTPVPQWVPDTPYPNGHCTIAAGRTTCVLVSWHNFGLAVDFAQWGLCGGNGHVTLIKLSTGCYNPGSQFFGTTAWIKVSQAMPDLGLLSGEDFRDPAHVEWHPYIVDYSQAGTRGTAYKSPKAGWPGYAWKIPSAIYTYTQYTHGSAPPFLHVVELVACDNSKWICVKEVRNTTFKDENNWTGTRETYDPPIKAFPAYTPVVNGYGGAYSNYNKAIHGTTTVVSRSYSISGSDRQHASETWQQVSGMSAYAPKFDVTDEQALADLTISHARRQGTTSTEQAAIVEQYKYLRDNSIYAVALPHPELLSQNGRSTIKNWDRYPEGGTVKVTITTGNGTQAPGVSVGLWFGWNRDDGTVGQYYVFDENVAKLPQKKYSLWETYKSSATTTTISGSLPKGATDKPWPYPTPPVASSPTPSPTDTGNGFFQP